MNDPLDHCWAQSCCVPTACKLQQEGEFARTMQRVHVDSAESASASHDVDDFLHHCAAR